MRHPFSSGAESMRKKVSGAIAVTLLFVSLTGCDPEALIKSKVPEPVQDLLTFSGAQSKSKVQLEPSGTGDSLTEKRHPLCIK